MKTITKKAFSTSEREIRDITKAWAAISFAFSNLLAASIADIGFIYTLFIAAITVGLGFILHELGHKIIAQHYGCFAEFRSWDNMLILAIIISFFGVIFAAPGGVMISGPLGKKRNGMISAAGPTINISLGIIFLAIAYFSTTQILTDIGRIGSVINIWLGIFNLIPFLNFDGRKIWDWSRAYYITLAIVGFGLLIMSTGISISP